MESMSVSSIVSPLSELSFDNVVDVTVWGGGAMVATTAVYGHNLFCMRAGGSMIYCFSVDS